MRAAPLFFIALGFCHQAFAEDLRGQTSARGRPIPYGTSGSVRENTTIGSNGTSVGEAVSHTARVVRDWVEPNVLDQMKNSSDAFGRPGNTIFIFEKTYYDVVDQEGFAFPGQIQTRLVGQGRNYQEANRDAQKTRESDAKNGTVEESRTGQVATQKSVAVYDKAAEKQSTQPAAATTSSSSQPKESTRSTPPEHDRSLEILRSLTRERSQQHRDDDRRKAEKLDQWSTAGGHTTALVTPEALERGVCRRTDCTNKFTGMNTSLTAITVDGSSLSKQMRQMGAMSIAVRG